MAVVTGMTAQKITEMTDVAVVSANIDQDTGVLTLQTKDGRVLNAGNVNPTSGVDAIIARAYPVGSLFFSILATNPATQLGVGTWTAFATGRVLVGVDPNQSEFDEPQQTGGEKTHTLSLLETPKHAHSIDHDHPSFDTSGQDGAHAHSPNFSTATGASGTNIPLGTNVTDRNSSSAFNSVDNESPSVHKHAIDVPKLTGSSGSSGGLPDGTTQPQNNLQPYITCYIWRRTA